MKKSSLGDIGGVGIILSSLLLIAGIALLWSPSPFGWLGGILLITCALFRGVGESRKVWSCHKCGTITARG